jgi:uncharacterized protein (TIGR00255 family)
MIRSMTGFGKATTTICGKLTQVEIRSVNSKQLDLSFRLPGFLKEKEAELRSVLSSRFERGKIEFSANFESSPGASNFSIDKELAGVYITELKSLADANGIKDSDYLSIVTRLPDVVKSGADSLSDQDWQAFLKAAYNAADLYDQFRLQEGEILEADFIARIKKILTALGKVEKFEEKRIHSIRERIRKNLREFLESENYDENRFEQELFYYIEKLDITEEKTRLKKHCDYFLDSLKEQENNGKKLNFITQEIGREINTLGSKANDADIQQLVVEMKDELEKIKEQLLNVL